jgi:hypothetical protein
VAAPATDFAAHPLVQERYVGRGLPGSGHDTSGSNLADPGHL